jgi:Rrf2 family protein
LKTLSQKTRYALRALQYLARTDRQAPVLIAELADKERLPRKFLEAILLELKNAGVLHSKKGKGGGYFLRKSADQISLGEVIRIFDGPLAPLPCVSERAFMACEECEDAETCGTRVVLKEVRDGMAKVLDRTTLADLIKRSDGLKKQRRAGSMYFI